MEKESGGRKERSNLRDGHRVSEEALVEKLKPHQLSFFFLFFQK